MAHRIGRYDEAAGVMGIWRLVGLLLASATPLHLAFSVLGRDMRRAVGGRLVQLGVAALIWCVVATALCAVAFVQPTTGPADYLLGLMALAGLLLFAYVHRAQWRWWRQRNAPGVGDGHGSPPPGSLSFARGLVALGDRHYYLRQFASHGPVFRMSQFGTPTLCVLGLDRRQDIIRQHGRALGPAPLPFSRSVLRGFLRYMDDATHNHYGPLMRRAMLGATPEWMYDRLAHGMRVRLSGIAQAPTTTHHASAFIEPLVREALDLMVFGFSVNDRDAGESGAEAAATFTRLGTDFYRVKSSQRLSATEEGMLEAVTAALQVQEETLRRRGLSETVPLGRIRGIEGSPPDRTVLQNFAFMHRIATNNVSGLIAWLLVFWAQHPEIVAQIRTSDVAEQHRLLARFVAETLRLSQSEYTYRTVVQTFAHDGVVYPAGWLVRFCVWESHRNAAAFDAPTEFRLRLGDQDYAKSHFAPFGTGRHACNGADLNEVICVTLLSVLVREFDVQVEAVEPLQRAPRHWGHWQPNARLALRITARGHS